jgi:hypothetical protein
MKKMDYQLKKFTFINKHFDLSKFFNVEVSEYRLMLMGRYTPAFTKECSQYLGEGKTHMTTGFLVFEKNGVTVILT